MRFDLIRFNSILFHFISFDLIRFDSIWFDSIRFYWIWFDLREPIYCRLKTKVLMGLLASRKQYCKYYLWITYLLISDTFPKFRMHPNKLKEMGYFQGKLLFKKKNNFGGFSLIFVGSWFRLLKISGVFVSG